MRILRAARADVAGDSCHGVLPAANGGGGRCIHIHDNELLALAGRSADAAGKGLEIVIEIQARRHAGQTRAFLINLIAGKDARQGIRLKYSGHAVPACRDALATLATFATFRSMNVPRLRTADLPIFEG